MTTRDLGPPAAPSGAPLWRGPAVGRLLVVTLLGFSSFCLTLAALPTWAARGGASAATAGLVTTVMLAATVATQTAVPWLLHRFGTGPTFAAGLVALGLPAPLLALSSGLAPLLAISLVRGTGFAVLTVVGASLTAGVAPAERRGEAIGLYGLAIAVPNLAAVPAGVALTQHGAFGWAAALAAAPLLGAPLAASLGRDVDRSAAHRQDTPVAGSHRSTLLAVCAPSLVLLSVTVAGGGLVTFLPIALPSGATATEALLLFGLLAAGSRWRAGLVADRWGTARLLPGSVVLTAVGMALVADGLSRHSSITLLVGALVFGAGYGCVQNLTLVVAFRRGGAGRTATASSAWNAAFDTGTGLGAGLVGAIASGGLGLPGALALTAGLMLASLPLTRAR